MFYFLLTMGLMSLFAHLITFILFLLATNDTVKIIRGVEDKERITRALCLFAAPLITIICIIALKEPRQRNDLDNCILPCGCAYECRCN